MRKIAHTIKFQDVKCRLAMLQIHGKNSGFTMLKCQAAIVTQIGAYAAS
ncbi:MAG: hypothetical protein LBC86_11405 [Oscillospiraceae bacterium]|nr:hypothetical protein [Oscillospiraceae bacterium]